MLTERSAQLLNLKDYGLVVGNPADVVLFDAQTPEQAIAEIRNPVSAFKRGRQTMLRRPPQLLRPSAGHAPLQMQTQSLAQSGT